MSDLMDELANDPGVQRELAVHIRREAAKQLFLSRHVGAGSSGSRLRLGGDFVFDEPVEIPALWGSGEQVLWAEGEGLMIAGGQGLGKTTIAQQLVLARLGLRPPELLGFPVRQSQRRALYLAMDRPRQAARSLRRMVGGMSRESVNERLLIWPGPLPVNVLASPQELADWVQRECPGVDLVVVDSVKDLAPGLSSDEVGAGINLAWQELIARGLQLLVLHHERKAQSGSTVRESALDDIYGSTWLTAGLGSVVQLTGKRGESQVKMHHLKQPAEVVGPLTVEHDHYSGVSVAVHEMTVENFMLLHVLGEPLTIDEIAAGVGKAQDAVRRRVQALVREGRAVEVTPSRNTGSGRAKATYRWSVGA